MKKLLTILILILSINAFSQWVPTNGPYGGPINCLTKKGVNLFAGTRLGILSTSNNGINWKKKCSGLDAGLTVNAIISNSSDIIAGTDNGIYISNNDGDSWIQSNNGLSNTDVRCLIFNNQDILLGSSTGIFKSTNLANSWTSSSIGVPNTTINEFAIFNNQIFAATNSGVFKSIDNGFSWSAANNGLSSTIVSSITIMGGSLYIGTTNGIYSSTDLGVNWVACNGNLSINQIYSIFSYGNSLFVGKDDDNLGQGLFRSDDNGVNWIQINNGIVHTPLTFQPVDFCFVNDGTNLYIGSHVGVHISSDIGDTWNGIGLGKGNMVNTIYKNDSFVLCGTDNGLYVSEDQGGNWKLSQSGLPSNVNIQSITESNSVFYIGTYSNGIYYSNDNCNTWVQSNSGLTSLHVNALATVAGSLYAGTVYTGTNQYGIYISNDNGANWVQSNNGLPILSIYSIVSSGTVVYIGTNEGVYMSTNNGNSWISSNNGMPITHTLSLAAIGQNIFAGQKYGGSVSSPYIGGVFVSNDYGSNWNINNFPSYKSVNALFNIGNVVYAGSDYLFRSDDFGLSWSYFADGFTDQDVSALAGDSIVLYAGKSPVFELNGVWKYEFSTASIANNNKDNKSLISIYPNPVKDYMMIDFRDGYTISDSYNLKIANTVGQVLCSEKLNKNSKVVDLSTWPMGLYFIQIIGENGELIKNSKIIIQ